MWGGRREAEERCPGISVMDLAWLFAPESRSDAVGPPDTPFPRYQCERCPPTSVLPSPVSASGLPLLHSRVWDAGALDRNFAAGILFGLLAGNACFSHTNGAKPIRLALLWGSGP